MSAAPAKIHLSTVTPVYQGENYLRDLVARLLAVKNLLEKENCPVVLAEAIFVDDGAIDGSAAVLAELARAHGWVKVIHLSRNFGQHPATIAGILHSSGEWVATLDEDLQHPPEKIMTMLAHAVGQSCDVVYANPEGTVHGLRGRMSLWYKAILSKLSGNPHVRHFNSFRMVRGNVARAAAALAGWETYLDVALGWFSSRVQSLPMRLVDPRFAAGKRSGYNFWGLLSHARRMLFTSQVKALRLGTMFGFLGLLASLALIVYIIVSKIVHPEGIVVQGWASIAVGLLFFGGLLSLLHGISLEYISLMAQQSLGRPVFLVVDRERDHILLDWIRERGQHAPLFS